MTPFPDNILMWSHYADNHKGICLLEFARNNPLICHARPVRYRKEYPEWTPHAIMDGNTIEPVLTKARDWCYEREFRIIASDLEGPTKLYHGTFIKLPPSALTAIIIGCENKAPLEIIEIVKEHSPGPNDQTGTPRAERLQDCDHRSAVNNHFKHPCGWLGTLVVAQVASPLNPPRVVQWCSSPRHPWRLGRP